MFENLESTLLQISSDVQDLVRVWDVLLMQNRHIAIRLRRVEAKVDAVWRVQRKRVQLDHTLKRLRDSDLKIP